MPTVGSRIRGLSLTARCPIRNCEVTGFEMKSGMAMRTPLGTYIEDNDTMHIPPHAVGDVEHFKGGDLWTLQPCGHTFRELPSDIAAELKELQKEAAEKPVRELMEILDKKGVGRHVPADQEALESYLRSVALAVLRRDR